MRAPKDYQKLHLKKYRDQFGLFIVEGKRLCQEALLSNWQIEAVFLEEEFQNKPENSDVIEQFTQRGLTTHLLKSSVFRKLSDTESPQGILLVIKKPALQRSLKSIIPKTGIVLIVDGVSDPGNLGTIIRSADWFGISIIMSSQETVDTYNLKVLRASMGSIFRIHPIQLRDIRKGIILLKENNFTIVGSFPKASSRLEEHIPAGPVALILGAEATGISSSIKSLIDIKVRIRNKGSAESLNVAVAGGILMNHYSQYF
jgi:TrmH family RNA methyltransferase